MLRLQTLGAVCLFAADGRPMQGPAAARRTLAMLATLAAAGDGGLSRDKLVGMFWPDVTDERARHSLTQTVYALRRAVGIEDLVVGVADLRLNPARIASDIAEFRAALDAHDDRRAMTAYTGHFLDGFILPAAPLEFEQWVSGRRAELESLASAAMQRVATRADVAGDLATAVLTWRRLAVLWPLDSTIATALVRALAESGDRAAALKAADVHVALLRNELGLEPTDELMRLARTVERRRVPSRQTAPAGVTPRAFDADPGAVDSSASPPLLPPSRDPMVMRWLHSALRRRATAAVLLAVAAVAIVMALVTRRRDALNVAVPLVTSRIVVAPFRVLGAAESLAYLRVGAVELLSGRLAMDSGSVADRGAIVNAWSVTGVAAEPGSRRDVLLRIATRMGAERLVTGSIVGSPDRLIVEAQMFALPAGKRVASATVRGSADSLGVLMDRIAARLLLDEIGEAARFMALPRGLPALHDYLAGVSALARGAYGAARTSLESAWRRDTTFAIAALRLAESAERMHDTPTARRAIAHAWIARDNLQPRDKRRLLAFAGPRYPAASTNAEQVAVWRELVERAPNESEAWLAYASRLFHDGATASLEGWRELSESAVERALALDPDNAAAAQLLVQLPLRSSESFGRARHLAESDSLDPVAAFLRWRSAALSDSADAIEPFHASVSRMRPATLRLMILAGLYDIRLRPEADRASGALAARAITVAERRESFEVAHSLALNASERPAVVARETPLTPSARLRLTVLDAIYGGANPESGAAAVAQLQNIDVPSAANANACVVAQWRLAHAQTTRVAETIAHLDTATDQSEQLVFASGARACAELLRAWLAVTTRSGTARALVSHLDSLAFTSYNAGDVATYAPLLIARLHARLGDRAAAVRALHRRGYMIGWPRYLASMEREEARLLRSQS